MKTALLLLCIALTACGGGDPATFDTSKMTLHQGSADYLVQKGIAYYSNSTAYTKGTNYPLGQANDMVMVCELSPGYYVEGDCPQ